MVEAPRPTSSLTLPLFFRIIPEPEREPGPHRGGGNGGFYSLIGFLVATIVLWRWGGVLTLAVMGLVAAGLFLWSKTRGRGP